MHFWNECSKLKIEGWAIDDMILEWWRLVPIIDLSDAFLLS